jgi:hypothetical protein
MNIGHGRLAGARGIATPPLEVVRALLIEHLLCHGVAHLHYLPDRSRIRKALCPFEEAGLISWNRWELHSGTPRKRGWRAPSRWP